MKKRASVVTNSKRLADALRQKQCTADSEHANTMGGKAEQCQVYPDDFCELVCREVKAEKSRQRPRQCRRCDEGDTYGLEHRHAHEATCRSGPKHV